MPGPTLYARYVPPKAAASPAVKNDEKIDVKIDETILTASPSLKRKREDPVERKQKKNKSDKGNAKAHIDVNDSIVPDQESQTIFDEQSRDKPKTKSKSKNIKSAKAADEASGIVEEITTSSKDGKISKKERRRKQSADSRNKDDEKSGDDELIARHAGVFSKFQKALDKAANQQVPDSADVDMEVVEEEPELHGLLQSISYSMITTN